MITITKRKTTQCGLSSQSAYDVEFMLPRSNALQYIFRYTILVNVSFTVNHIINTGNHARIPYKQSESLIASNSSAPHRSLISQRHRSVSLTPLVNDLRWLVGCSEHCTCPSHSTTSGDSPEIIEIQIEFDA